jgi:RNA polymerase sigma-70 factor (ECF subfamily)
MFMTESSSDTALGDQLRQGNEQSLAEMFLKHGERFRRIIHFRMDDRLHGRVDPDDVLQEAYLAAAKRLDHFAQSDISAFVWLRLIVGQTLIDIHRRHIGAQARDAGREIPIHGMGGGKTTSASLAQALMGSFTSPSHAVARDELALQLAQVIDELEPIDREILALRHFEELSNLEISEVLKIQQKAASIRYIRALKRLKSKLAGQPGFEETE